MRKGGLIIKRIILPTMLAALCLSPFASARGESLADLDGKRLVLFAQSGEWTADDIWAATGVLPATLLWVDAPEEALAALENNKADLILAAGPTARYIDNSTADRWTMVPIANEITLTMVARDDALRAALDEEIAALWADGTAEALFDAWCVQPLKEVQVMPKAAPRLHAQVLRVGVSGACPPFEALAPDGSLSGFNVAYLREIAGRMGVTLDWIRLAANECPAALDRGELDLYLGLDFIARQETLSVTQPFAKTEGVFLFRNR